MPMPMLSYPFFRSQNFFFTGDLVAGIDALIPFSTLSSSESSVNRTLVGLRVAFTVADFWRVREDKTPGELRVDDLLGTPGLSTLVLDINSSSGGGAWSGGGGITGTCGVGGADTGISMEGSVGGSSVGGGGRLNISRDCIGDGDGESDSVGA